MLDARGYPVGCQGLPCWMARATLCLLVSLSLKCSRSKAATFGRITTEECGTLPWNMPIEEDLPVVEKICRGGCVLCFVPGDFFDVVKGGSSLLEGLRKMIPSSPLKISGWRNKMTSQDINCIFCVNARASQGFWEPRRQMWMAEDL